MYINMSRSGRCQMQRAPPLVVAAFIPPHSAESARRRALRP